MRNSSLVKNTSVQMFGVSKIVLMFWKEDLCQKCIKNTAKKSHIVKCSNLK